ncbi:MAG TPA: hypothetical protein VEK56_02060, partial [Vicinamibacterales bacterium]|nr:hypothetical protein [Vicinamibacterales bacterium]
MSGIDLRRVVFGGLLAGLLINISEFILNGVLFADEMNAAMAALNRPPLDNRMIGWFVLLGFALGIVTVWLYAAIRPRFGAGPGTAACAAATTWFLAYCYPNIGAAVMGLFPTPMIVIGTVWGLAEILVAGVAGAWVYTE